ncbi:type III glutamate--ammonia ligase [Kaistia dalseonensis]|uniref:Glutamine synthetase n=1 Tax=Kaistia dalseonensis TaxID=410840 RepID=A0ABU0H757_9HYPH|nr:type III glutamate--ammonia ligase [Kaistia dalseonensis]MCX5495276.1 type III glutamate--ammonia ligase [Kaistia dalseonensis]MDQ0437862.1 glutamine synthetase [Kaistia dalseonensis]
MAIDLAETAKAKGIRYFLISYTDLFGTQRAKLVPAQAIGEMQKAGASFAGFATWLDMTPADPDVFAVPDPESLIQLPWKPEVGWLAADPWMGGKLVAQAPRNVLKKQIAAAAALGYQMKTGVECEFFLVTPDGKAISDAADYQAKPCYDQSALMRRYDVITEICDAMLSLGWQPYQNDHEDANGQFEMNWHYDDALVTADRHAFFKYMAKSIAEKHGLRATFMPKPFAALTGNGCHAHISLWKDGVNVFEAADGELGVSKLGYHFLGGLLAHAGAFAALTNPTVNSYKRINAPVTRSGATWSPNTISYTGNNRTHMIRIPDAGRFELRLADGAANPYLLQAAILAAGLDGLAKETSPGQRLDLNMYTDGHKVKGARKLPLNLLDALRAFEKSSLLAESLGPEFVTAYARLKMGEWNDYAGHLTEWERAATLDC